MAPLRRSLQLPHPVVSCGDPRTAATLPNPLAPHGAAVGAATAGPLTVTIVRTRTLAAVPALRAGPQAMKAARSSTAHGGGGGGGGGGGDRSQLTAAHSHAAEHHFLVPSLYHGEPLSLVVSCHASAQSAAMALVVTAPVPMPSATASTGTVDHDGDVPMALARGQPVPLRAVRWRGEIAAEPGQTPTLLGACVDAVEVGDGDGDVDADSPAASRVGAGEAGVAGGDTHALSFPAADAAGAAARHVCGPQMARTAAAQEASHALIQVDLVVPPAGRDRDTATKVASVFLHFRPLLFLAERLHAQAVPAAAALGTAVADRDPDAALAILKSHLLAAAQLAAWPILARPNLALLASIDPVADSDLDLAAAIDAKMVVPNVYCICDAGQASAGAGAGSAPALRGGQALAQNDNRVRRDPMVLDWPAGLPSPSHETVAHRRGTQPAIDRISSGGRTAPGSGVFAHMPPTPPSVNLAATSRRRVAAPRAAVTNPPTHPRAVASAPSDTHPRADTLPMAQTLDRYRRTGALEFMLPSPLPSPTSSVSSSPVTATTARGVAQREPTAIVPLRPVGETSPIRITESPSPIDAVNVTTAPPPCPCPDCVRPNERARWTRHDYGTDDTLMHGRTATKRAALPCACPECATASLPPAKRLAVAHPAMTRPPVTHRDVPQVVLPSVSEWFDKRPLSPLLQPMPPLVTTQQSTPCPVPGCTKCGMRDTSALRSIRPTHYMSAPTMATTNCPSYYVPSARHHITADRAAVIVPMPPPHWHAPHRREQVAESRVPLPAAARIHYCE
ncbi:hypothetical protein GGF32_004863 [Allomyces javanicus]|nr:hypothetical protein GGF32_004863 [Allomyces javanicus]